MKIINEKRGSGKTTKLVYMSCLTRKPIVVMNESHKRYVEDMAKQLSLDIPEPMTVNDIVNEKYRGVRFDGVLVDEFPFVFEEIMKRFGLEPDIVTGTIDKNN